jgi:hypothetical protein
VLNLGFGFGFGFIATNRETLDLNEHRYQFALGPLSFRPQSRTRTRPENNGAEQDPERKQWKRQKRRALEGEGGIP